jgi:hypothetical protein
MLNWQFSNLHLFWALLLMCLLYIASMYNLCQTNIFLMGQKYSGALVLPQSDRKHVFVRHLLYRFFCWIMSYSASCWFLFIFYLFVFSFFLFFFMQESPTPTKLIASFSHGLSESRRSKLTVERHRVLSLLFLDPSVRFWSSLWYFDW